MGSLYVPDPAQNGFVERSSLLCFELITTFTSDRTKPTEDAGAEVTTGRIEFDKGNATYRYVKCEITSRVDADGNVVEDSDVNVAEVQITVWSCK